jgi:PAS domain S-box-containing protein
MNHARAPGGLDLSGVLEASRTICGEVVLERLLATLMQIVIEHAGAQRGLLILVKEGRLVIEVEGTVDRDEVLVLPSIPVEPDGRGLLPAAIVNHVAHTRESVILDDAAGSESFASDPYIIESLCRSILCIPLDYHNQLVGILYLESDQGPGAFTPDRVQVAEFLSTQAAISIEHVRRVREVETLYQAGTIVAATLQLEEAIDCILEQLAQVVPYDSATVQLLREGYLEIVGGRGWQDPAAIEGMCFPIPGDNPNTVVIEQHQSHILADAPAVYPSFCGSTSSHIRSWLGVPLIIHDRVIGMLAVDSTQPDYFSATHARLATAFAAQVAVALHNAQLYDAARQHATELETLRRTSMQLVSSLDLSAVLDSIAESALALVGATDCLIYLYDGASDSFSFGTALGRWAERDIVLAPREGGLTTTVVRQGRPVVIDDAVGHPLYATPEAQEWQIQSIAGFPLQRAGRVLGVLHVAFVEPHIFLEGELRVLGLLADQAAIAIENARLFEAERAQLAELTVLHAVATASAEADREDVLIERVTKIIGETLYPADVFGVMLLDEAANVLHVHPSYNVAEQKEHLWRAALVRLLGEDEKGVPIPVGQGITGKVAATGQPWRVGDVTRVPEYIDGGVGTHSELCVPLKVGERVIGVINAESTQRNAFSEADERLLATVAGQLATAVEKLRLYEEAQRELVERVRVEEELRKHRDHLEELVNERTAALREANAQLQQEIGERAQAEAEREQLVAAVGAQAVRQAALLRLSAELAATLEETQVCRHVVDGLHDTLGYDFVAIYLLDRVTGERVHSASIGFVEPPPRIAPGEGLSERPLLSGHLQYTPDVTQDPQYFYGMGGSEVDVPIRIGGEVLGVLVAESKQRDGFDQDDFEVLTAAVQQAGLAIEKARLLGAERQRADELDALRTTMAEITSELELSALLQDIVKRAAELLDATGGELGLYDEASQEVEVLVCHNMGKDYVSTRMALGEGAMGRVAETRKPIIIEDYQTWEGRAPQYAEVGMHGGLAAPLTVGDRLVGVITIADARPDRRYGSADLHLLNLFAQQAAIAMENARLFSEAERRVAELATLTDIGQALSSTLRVDKVLELVYKQTRRVMHAENMIIMLYDEENDEIMCAFSRRPDDAVAGMPFPKTGLTGYIIKHRKSVLLPSDVIEGIRQLGIEVVGIPSASFLGVPMLRADRVLGAIILQHYTTPNVYDASHQVLLETIASQAATAIENARLYDQAQREITERVRAEEALRMYQEHLEELVEGRTADLRASEERYRSLFDGVPVGLYRTTPEGQVLDANLANIQMFGFPSREELLAGNVISDYVDPEDRVRWQTLMEREGQVRDFEAQMYNQDGAVIWINDNARAVMGEGGQVLYYEGSLEDITERKRAEAELRKYQEHLEELVEERTAELRESEERYRTLFDGVPAGLYRTTPSGQILDANLAAVEMLGYPSREDLLRASTIDLFVNPMEAARARVSIDRGKTVRDFEMRLHRHDGTVVWMNYSARAVRDEEGQVLYYEGSMQDITERKRAEAELRKYQEQLEELVEERTAELRESEERYRTLFDGVPVGLYRSTPSGQIVDANSALVEMLGFPSREDYLMTDSASLYVDPEDRVQWQALMEREGTVRDFEVQLQQPDGTVLWICDTARAVRDELGQVLYYEGSVEDITERKQAQQKLEASEEQFRTLYQATRDAVMLLDDTAFFDCNPATLEIFGCETREQFVGKHPSEFSPEYQPEGQDSVSLSARRIETALREGSCFFEWQHIRLDGTEFPAEVLLSAMEIRGRKILQAVVRDITERKNAEAELRKYQEQLEELVKERTAELQESEERYRTLFDGVPMGLYRTTPAGEVLEFNRAGIEMFRWPSGGETPALNTASLYVDPQDRVRWQMLMEREGVVRDFEAQVRRYDDQVIWINDTARAVKDEHDQVLYYEGSLEDISERKEFEEEIRRQKDYYEALFLNSPVAVVTGDLEGKVLSWNPEAEKLFGYTQEEMIGTNLDEAVARQDPLRAEAARYTQQVVNVGRIQATTRRTRRDGSLVDVELLALPMVLAGEKVGFIAIYHDITERKRIERELRYQKEYFEALFVNSPVAVVTVDMNVDIVSWNPAAEELFGYTEEEVLGRNADAVVANDPRIHEEALHYTEQALTTQRIQATTRRTRKDGSLVDVEVLALPVIVGQEMVGYIAIYVDIADLQQARREAEAASQAKGAFLANMSHELRTPLNAILGFTQLMDGDPNLTPGQQENLAIINQSGEHLLALINDVLEMSKIEAGRVTLQEASFDLYAMLDGLEEMFRLRAGEKHLSLSVRRAEDVPRYVRSDEAKLRQVLSNLLGNAVKFTREGSVALRVSLTDIIPTAQYSAATLHFEVEDTGPGIAPEELELVFDPFVQASAEQQPREGTGLGLSISRQYVRLMGGDLFVSSELDHGSLFSFDVQVAVADAAEGEGVWPRRQVLGLAPDQRAPDGGPFRLLIVEDRETNRQLLVKLLTGLGSPPLGFEVREAVNGQEAIEVWERWEPHLIWMDMRMPIMDGHEATRQIKATPKGRETVIIALTATAFEEDRQEILAEGCDDFVRKPFRKDEIFDMLAKYLGVRFIYEEGPVLPGAVEAAGPNLSPGVAPAVEALSALPSDWRAELQQVTIKADLKQMLNLIEQIRDQNPALADTLVHMALNFEYRGILTLIEKAGGEM